MKATFLLKKLVKRWFDEIFLRWGVNSSSYHTVHIVHSSVSKNEKFHEIFFWWERISEIATLWNVNLTEFLRKNHGNNSVISSVCTVHTKKISEIFSKLKLLIYIVTSSIVEMLLSRNFCQSENEFPAHRWKLWEFSFAHFWQTFRESNGFTK